MGTTVRTKRFLGKCKTCKAGHAEDVEETVESRVQPYRTPQGGQMERTIRRYSYSGLGSSSEPMKAKTVVAPCGHRVVLKRVNGTFTDHVCNDKCMSSTGSVCECSCGGKNHGSGFLVVLK